jgi:hypothetical protein
MKVAVIGSRNFEDYDLMENELKKHDITKIISGGARGADTMAEFYANCFDIEFKLIKPDWNKYGKVAGFRRNKQIVNEAELVIAFWDMRSKGTEHAIRYAKSLKKDVIIVKINKELVINGEENES